MPSPPTKSKKVFIGNAQKKRICGYKLVGYQSIEKNGYSIKQEIREPVFEEEGKFQGIKLSEKFLQKFMIDENDLLPGFVIISSKNQ